MFLLLQVKKNEFDTLGNRRQVKNFRLVNDTFYACFRNATQRDHAKDGQDKGIE